MAMLHDRSSNEIKSKIYAPNLPWNVYNAEDLGPCIMQFLNDQEPFYRRWAQMWYENFQYVMGNQQVRWSKRYDFAVDYDFLLTQVPSINQKSQTNLTRGIAESLTSVLFGNMPDWEVETTDESSVKGKRYRIIAQKVLDAYMTRLCMHQEFDIGALMMVLYGQFAWWVDFDKSAGAILELPRYRKVRKPMFGEYMAPNPATQGLIEVPTPFVGSEGQPVITESWERELDDMGREIVDKVKAGDVFVDTLSPFEYRRPIGSPGPHKDKYVQRLLILDYDEFLEKYDKVGGKTALYYKVKPVFSDPAIFAFAAKHFLRMQYTTPPTLDDISGKKTNSVFRSTLFKHKVIVVEHYDKPHLKKWPLGRRVIIANGVCTHVTVPSYQTNCLDGWHPMIESQWMRVPPSIMASGPLNDAIQKNRELNVKDSLIATSVRRNFGSILALKTGAGFDRSMMSGEPGAIIEVQDPFGARWIHDDMPISPVIEKLRQNDKEDVYEVSGAGDAIRGERSPNTSSGYLARQLEEREQKRLTRGKINFEMGVSGLGQKLFTCLRTNVKRVDPWVMSFVMRSAAGRFTTDDAITMLTGPIDYGIEINVKKSSMALRSKATQQATLMELVDKPAMQQRLSQDAKVVDEFLKEFDITTLRDRSAPHRDRCDRENEIFLDMLRLGPDTEGLTQPRVLFADDDMIHLAGHEEFEVQHADDLMKNEGLLRLFLMHKEQHRLQSQEKTGELIPGASFQVPAMMATGRQSPLPTVQTIAQDKQLRMMKQQEQQQGANPQAPTQPKPEPGVKGPPQKDPNAPSQNTSPANQGGPPQ